MLHDSATIQANHDRFVMRVAVSEIVWALNGDLAGLELAPRELRGKIFDAMGPERIQQYIQRFRAAMEQQG